MRDYLHASTDILFILCTLLLTQWRNIRLFYTFVVATQNRSRFEPDPVPTSLPAAYPIFVDTPLIREASNCKQVTTKLSLKVLSLFTLIHNKITISSWCRNSHRMSFVKNGALENSEKYNGKHLCQSLFFTQFYVWDSIIKETARHLFSRKF